MNRKINPKIEEVVQKYAKRNGLPIIMVGFGHLFAIGHTTFNEITEEDLSAQEEEIRQKEKKIEESGGCSIMTAEFQINIMRLAYELSKIDLWDLLYYVKKILPIN